MSASLMSEEGLREASASALSRFRTEPEYQDWIRRLARHLEVVRTASAEDFRSESFQAALWNDEAVSATGQGNIDVAHVMRDPGTQVLLDEFRSAKLPEAREERIVALETMWTRMYDHVEPMVPRMPRLKLFRVFAALFPVDFTTIAHRAKLNTLAAALGIPSPSARSGVAVHRDIIDRFSNALGDPPPPTTSEGLERMSLPWLVYAMHAHQQGDAATESPTAVSGTEALKPLPADRRRKGLMAIGGYLTSLRSMIEFAREGCTREDFKAHIRSVNPNLGESAGGVTLNALIAEWGVLKASGDQLALTPRGEAFLESGDADDVSDWLLTRILGFDHVLVEIDRTAIDPPTLIAHLQRVNPGWTNKFGPSVLISWARTMKLAELGKDSLLRLTERGLEWRRRINWEPEFLAKSPPAALVEEERRPAKSDGASALSMPSFDRLLQAMPTQYAFPAEIVARLHAGLWSHPRRHFAVLAGLSGTGKTLLARSYATALRVGDDVPSDGLYTLPVQPGWHDPAPLLGYVTPLSNRSYVRTPFLDFLLRAAGDPTRAFTVVLDEMNLSHPEQYFAPLLSAMETGEELRFHTEEDELSGVPPKLAYPSNLLVIGTVNMDETTHGLSDKVLDRACVVDFWDVDVAAYPGWRTSGLSVEVERRAREVLQVLANALRPVRLHFGWRTIGDVVGYLAVARQTGHLSDSQALDFAVHGKILTKLRGEESPPLREALEAVRKELTLHGLEHSASKMRDLIEELTYRGHARYWQ